MYARLQLRGDIISLILQTLPVFTQVLLGDLQVSGLFKRFELTASRFHHGHEPCHILGHLVIIRGILVDILYFPESVYFGIVHDSCNLFDKLESCITRLDREFRPVIGVG